MIMNQFGASFNVNLKLEGDKNENVRYQILWRSFSILKTARIKLAVKTSEYLHKPSFWQRKGKKRWGR
jgi:hypothetical protein